MASRVYNKYCLLGNTQKKKCPVCGKNFNAYSEWIYRQNTRYFCSYTCFRAGKKQTNNGLRIPLTTEEWHEFIEKVKDVPISALLPYVHMGERTLSECLSGEKKPGRPAANMIMGAVKRYKEAQSVAR